MKEYLEKIKIHHILIVVLLIIVAVLYFDNRQFKKILYRQQYMVDSYYDNMNDFYGRRQHNRFYDNYDSYGRKQYYNYDCPRRQYFMNDYFNNIDRDIDSKILEMEKEFKRLSRDFERLNGRPVEPNRKLEEPKKLDDKKLPKKQEEKGRKRLEEKRKPMDTIDFVYNPQIRQDEKNFELTLNLPKNINKEDVDVNFINNNLVVKVNKHIKEGDSFFKHTFFESYYVSGTKATKKDIKIDLRKDTLKVIVPIIK